MSAAQATPEGTAAEEAEEADQALARRDLERLTVLADAIVAIAATLLVLPLVDAASQAASDRQSSAHLVRHDLPLIISFVVSFFVIFDLWRSHRDLFSRLERGDAVLSWGTQVWLLTLVVTPFTEQLLAADASDRLPQCLYAAVLLVSCACLAVMKRHVAHRPELLAPAVRGRRLAEEVPAAFGVLFVVIIVLALVGPRPSPYDFLVLFAARPLLVAGRALARRRGRSQLGG